MQIKILLFSILLSITKGCLNSKEIKLHLKNEEPLTMEELTSVMKTSDFDAKKQDLKNLKIKENFCTKLVTTFAKSLHQLHDYLPKIDDSESSLPFLISKLNSDDCSGPSLQKSLKLIYEINNQQEHKLGVILPLTGEYKNYGNAVLKGMRSINKEKFENKIIIKDSYSSKEGALKALAQLIFKEQVTMILGGLSDEEAKSIIPFSSNIYTPMFIINRNHKLIEESSNAFRFFPNEIDLSKILTKAVKDRGFKKIAFLIAEENSNKTLIKAFKDSLKKDNVNVVIEAFYKTGNYDSMNNAISIITRTNPKNRENEYLNLVNLAKKKASIEGREFDANSVFLAPKIMADAIFIPADFRMVRYFVKLFKYHGVHSIPLIGTQQWRSGEIIKPWDKFLNGSIFADYIGEYNKLLTSNKNKSFFVSEEEAIFIDFQMIGIRASKVITPILEIPFLKRKFLTKQIFKEMVNNGKNKAFYRNRHSWWPTYVFQIKDNGNILRFRR